MKCMVYNLEDPNIKEFALVHNGKVVQGKCGIEINLKPEYIECLEHAVQDATIVIDNKPIHINNPRFKVVRLEAEAQSTKK